MSNPNPTPPVTPEYQTPGQTKSPLSGRDAYNVVTDTITGPNVRLRDNLIQLAAVVAGALLGAGIGALTMQDRLVGAMVGAVCGLIGGVLISGAALGIYRATRHIKGKHS